MCKDGHGARFYSAKNEAAAKAMHLGLGPNERLGMLTVSFL
jgi:hypothetical protein